MPVKGGTHTDIIIACEKDHFVVKWLFNIYFRPKRKREREREREKKKHSVTARLFLVDLNAKRSLCGIQASLHKPGGHPSLERQWRLHLGSRASAINLSNAHSAVQDRQPNVLKKDFLLNRTFSVIRSLSAVSFFFVDC